MTAEFGAHTQLEKIEMLDVADLVVLNKYEKRGSEDALRAIPKQVRRNRNLFDVADEELPVVATIASQFADPGVDALWQKLSAMVGFEARVPMEIVGERKGVIPQSVFTTFRTLLQPFEPITKEKQPLPRNSAFVNTLNLQGTRSIHRKRCGRPNSELLKN